MTSCGATSAYGSHGDRKTTRFSMPPRQRRPAASRRGVIGEKTMCSRLLVRLLEALDLLVAALHAIVERLLRGLLPAPHRLELLVDDVANLHEVAEAQPLRVGRRRLVRELLDRDVEARTLGVEALLLREIVSRRRDRHVARVLVPLLLHFGRREEREELRDALVVLLVLLV